MRKILNIKRELEIMEKITTVEKLVLLEDNYMISDSEGNFFVENCDNCSQVYPVSKDIIEKFIELKKESSTVDFFIKSVMNGEEIVNEYFEDLNKFINGEIVEVPLHI